MQGEQGSWFGVTGARPTTGAVAFRVRITDGSGGFICGVRLWAQVSIRAQQRRYTAAEAAGLEDLFGPPARWGQTLAPVPWAEAAVEEGAFRGRTEAVVVLPCAPESAAGKYFGALAGGTAPLLFLFRGQIWHGAAGWRMTPIPRDREARFPLPLAVWRQAAGREPVAAAEAAGGRAGHGL